MQGDIDAYMANVKKFTEKTGIEVRVDNEGWEDVRPEGRGRGQHRRRPRHHPVDQRRRQPVSGQAARRDRPRRLPRQEVRRLVPGRRRPYLRPDGKKWIGLPLGAAGSMMVYRESMVKAAGFDTFPKDTDGFLKL